MGRVIHSSVAMPSELSANFQEASGNASDQDVERVTDEPALLRHWQWGWSLCPQLLQIEEFKGKRDHQPSLSDLSCFMCHSAVLCRNQHDVFG